MSRWPPFGNIWSSGRDVFTKTISIQLNVNLSDAAFCFSRQALGIELNDLHYDNSITTGNLIAKRNAGKSTLIGELQGSDNIEIIPFRALIMISFAYF